MRQILCLLLCCLPAAVLAGPPQIVEIEADRDATLIESDAGLLANGSGPALFVGRTSQNDDSRRRGLVRFDIASVVPRGATIVDVELRLTVNPSNAAPRQIRLHRLLSDWSEGPSSASGGGGRPAEPGDVTWIHTTYDDRFWPRPGGLFVARESAVFEASGSGLYVVADDGRPGPSLLGDVRRWRTNMHPNFGWLLIGDETTGQTTKNFASREDGDPGRRPVLIIHYRD